MLLLAQDTVDVLALYSMLFHIVNTKCGHFKKTRVNEARKREIEVGGRKKRGWERRDDKKTEKKWNQSWALRKAEVGGSL